MTSPKEGPNPAEIFAIIAQRKAFLGQLPLFEGFSGEELETVSEFAVEQSLPAGMIPLNINPALDGDNYPGVYIVQDGQVVARKQVGPVIYGPHFEPTIYGSGQFFVVVSSQTVKVISQGAGLLILPKENLGRFLADKPHLMRNFIDLIS